MHCRRQALVLSTLHPLLRLEGACVTRSNPALPVAFPRAGDPAPHPPVSRWSSRSRTLEDSTGNIRRIGGGGKIQSTRKTRDQNTCDGVWMLQVTGAGTWGLRFCSGAWRRATWEKGQRSYMMTHLYLCTPAHVPQAWPQEKDGCGTHIPGRWQVGGKQQSTSREATQRGFLSQWNK